MEDNNNRTSKSTASRTSKPLPLNRNALVAKHNVAPSTDIVLLSIFIIYQP